MALICAISNEVPESPVVSPASGSIFEKRLIVKYIEENGRDPINGKDLRIEDLIDLKTPAIVKPRPPSATSIPAILKLLQDEWDAVMLNSFTLRQQLQTARQEVSHALYQHDAACRVIARLTKEVTAAREALATLKPKAGAPSMSNNDKVPGGGDSNLGQDAGQEEEGITGQVLEKLEAMAAVLTAERKKRGKQLPPELIKPEEITNFVTKLSPTGLHSTSTPGILCMDICPTDTDKIVTGGNDKNVVIFDKDKEQILTVLQGHSKKVTNVIFHPDKNTVISASPDSQIRIWNIRNNTLRQKLDAHEGPITAISLHATGDYLLSTSNDENWAFSDLNTGRLLAKVGDSETPHSLTTAQFHPDGLIFGTGTSNSLIKIWDLKEKSNVANFPGHSGQICAMSFSENGYYLATAAEDSVIKLWDLRKLKNFKTITLDEDYQVKDLFFDRSGQYLAVAGTDVRVYICKQWECLRQFPDHTAVATAVRFGHNARFLASVSLDRTLKIYSPKD